MALNQLTADFARRPLEFLRAKTINPPAPDAVLRRERTIPINPGSLRFFGKEVWQQQKALETRFTSATTETPIGWISLSPDIVMTGGVTFDVEFASDPLADYERRIEAADRLPVYFLPWKPDHLLRMHIPRYRIENIVTKFGGAIDLDPYSPHIFFTAGLTGCSVFVYGDPREPVVTHAGTQGSVPYGSDCARFWREILLLERFQRLQHEGIAHEANVDQYMGNTTAMKAFQQWLAHQPSEFTVEQVVNFGAVFGIRYGALWSFYLQENAFVSRFKIVQGTMLVKETRQVPTVKKSPLSSIGITAFNKTVMKEVPVVVRVPFPDKERSYTTIPIGVRAFYPSGPGRADFWDRFQQNYR